MWVAEQKCILSVLFECDGPIQVHHLLRPWDGERGTGMRANDKNTVPLCMKHHSALHMAGNEDVFFHDKTGEYETGRYLAQQFWEAHRILLLKAIVKTKHNSWIGKAPTPALAICIAALKAREDEG